MTTTAITQKDPEQQPLSMLLAAWASCTCRECVGVERFACRKLQDMWVAAAAPQSGVEQQRAHAAWSSCDCAGCIALRGQMQCEALRRLRLKTPSDETGFRNVKRCDDISDEMINVDNGITLFHKPFWHESIEVARQHAETLRFAAIKSAEKRIAKLTKFKIKEPSDG